MKMMVATKRVMLTIFISESSLSMMIGSMTTPSKMTQKARVVHIDDSS